MEIITFYNKTINKNKYHVDHPFCFFFCDSKIQFLFNVSSSFILLKQETKKTMNFYFNTLFL